MSRRVLVVGIGGLGCPAAIALVRGGVDVLGIADDDEVDVTNLHRQILFSEADVGKPKVASAIRALSKYAGDRTVEFIDHGTRLLPDNAVELALQYDVIVEGSDNFATKFLTADACRLAERPVVHAAAVRWHGTALAVGPRGGPCYRCLFEDLPLDNPPNCAEAGVIGPMVGVVAAVQADLALSVLDGAAAGAEPFGELFTFDGKTLEHRRRKIARRKDCPLCGDAHRIRDIEAKRYAVGVTCTA
jgi:molybdopterin/thiamine biosynthesis adenylyltransferase